MWSPFNCCKVEIKREKVIQHLRSEPLNFGTTCLRKSCYKRLEVLWTLIFISCHFNYNLFFSVILLWQCCYFVCWEFINVFLTFAVAIRALVELAALLVTILQLTDVCSPPYAYLLHSSLSNILNMNITTCIVDSLLRSYKNDWKPSWFEIEMIAAFRRNEKPIKKILGVIQNCLNCLFQLIFDSQLVLT